MNLPNGPDPDKLGRHLRDGVPDGRIPVTAAMRPKRIAIRTGEQRKALAAESPGARPRLSGVLQEPPEATSPTRYPTSHQGMAMNNVQGAGRAPSGFGQSSEPAQQFATVQLGERTLAEVAGRLNVDVQALAQANPQIRDLNSLKAGQEVRLPAVRTGTEKTSASAAQEAGPSPSAMTLQGTLPALGDPITKSLAQLKLQQGSVLGFQTQQPVPPIQAQAPAPGPNAAAQAQIDALGQAAASGNLQQVKDLLKAGADINGKESQNGQTALAQAAAAGRKDVVEYLLKAGADVDKSDSQGRTPLFLAAQSGHAEMIRILRQHGGHPDLADLDGRTPLMEAAAKGDVKSIKALTTGRGGADVNAGDNNGRTALMEAALSGNPQAVKALFDQLVSIGGADNFGQTALMEAAKKGNREVVKLLMDKITGPDLNIIAGDLINAADQDGRTALMEAARKGNKDAVQQLLVSKETKLDLQDAKGRTALVEAASGGSAEIVKALVAKGANVNVPDQEGRTALMEAAKAGNGDAVQALLKGRNAAAGLDLQDKAGRTALLDAVQRGDVRSVKALVDAGARLDIQDANGDTPLTSAKSLRKTTFSMEAEFDQIIKLLEKPKP